MEITAGMVKELREKTGAGVMECRSALASCGGNIEKAIELLKEKGMAKAEKKAGRATGQGVVAAYIHTGGRIGAMVELNCETDFVARTDEFKGLAHCLAMQVAALNPSYISEDQIPPGENVDPKEACLLSQVYIKDPSITIKELISGTIAKTGENIRVRRFIRYELGN